MSDTADSLRRAHWTGWRPTHEGRYWLGIVVILLTVGIVKNINLLTLVGFVMLAIIALSSLVVGRRLKWLEGRRVLEETILAGSPTRLEVRLTNSSTKPIRAVRLEDGGEAHQFGWYLDKIDPKNRQNFLTEVTLPQRGWYNFAPLAAISSYPFGLWQRRVFIGTPTRVLVLPRPGKLQRDRLRQYLRGRDPYGERIRRHGWRHETAQADFHGLRPFRLGDSPRWIHWRTSARRGELMVREFEDIPGEDLLLVLDSAEGSEQVEALISLAATIIWEWNQRRGDRFLLGLGGEPAELHDGLTGPEHLRALLERLALLPRDNLGPAPVALLSEAIPPTVAVVVLSLGETDLTAQVEARLHRPVTLLIPEQLEGSGVYTPP